MTERKYFNDTGVGFSQTISVYDWAGRLISQTNPDGGVIRLTYQPNGLLSRTVDAMDFVSEFRYDAMNRLTETYMQTGTAGLFTGVRYDYDNASRMIRETHFINPVNLGSLTGPAVTTNYMYNADGTLREQSDSSGRRTAFTYDRAGNVIREERRMNTAQNQVTEYTFNTSNNNHPLFI